MREQDEKTELEQIMGSVETIVFRKQETGFTVLELDRAGELVTVVGELPYVEAGEEVTLTGSFVAHPTFGNQFKARLCERRLPATEAAIVKYLGGGIVKGIGPAIARRIVSAFGLETLNVIENSPARLSEVKGISKSKADAISAEFARAFGVRKVMLYLEKLNLPSYTMINVWKKWGACAIDMIEENPYILCSPEIGMDFPAADEAFNSRVAPDDFHRLAAGMCFVLIHNLGNGHSCLPEEKLLGAAVSLLNMEELEPVLERLLDEHRLDSVELEGRQYIYLPEYFEAETVASGRLKMMLSLNCQNSISVDASIEMLEKELDIEYDELQKRAIREALQNNIFVLTGGPGTGKTTTLNAIIRLFEQRGDEVLLAAPTGRAAKRLSELTGREAKTIHRLLEVDSHDNSSFAQFRKNEKNPLKCDVLIIDEMSMVDSLLFSAVLKALNFSSKLVLVGDPDQLPSVGAGNVLRDIVASDMLPSVCLDRIFRQAAESMIVTNAHDIVRGEYPTLESRDNDFFFLSRQSPDEAAATVIQLCEKRLPKAYGFSPMWDIQVLCPGKRGELGTWALNHSLQEHLNPPDGKKKEFRFSGGTFREGDKVMQIRNNYDIVWKKDDGEMGTGVFNGDIGMIMSIDASTRLLSVRFDDRVADYQFEASSELEHAYAITVHKSQGSEFEAVIIPLFDNSPRLCYRNLLYTAVTRAKQLLIVVGSERSVMYMVDNNKRTVRYTNLRRFLESDEF